MSTPILTVAPAGTWNLDPIHSRVDFGVSYLAGTFKGEFHEIGGELSVDAERASLEGTAKVASVDVKDKNLSAHLQSPDFFDAERHPELRFAARDIRLDGGKVSVDGELTIKGVIKPVARRGRGRWPGRRARALRRSQSGSAVRRGRRCPPAPDKRRAPERGDRKRRRGAHRDAGVQRVHSGPAEERDRLGLAPGRDERAAEQACGRRRCEHRRLRGGLGTGRAP